MNGYPKSFRESRKLSLIYAGIFVLIFLGGMIAVASGKPAFMELLTAWAIVAVVLLLFVALYPAGSLVIYEDRFIYKKGRYILEASWSEVQEIAFQREGGGGIPTSFFIDTSKGSTKLLDILTLVVSETGKKVDQKSFIQELELISHKEIMLGNLGTKSYHPNVYKFLP